MLGVVPEWMLELFSAWGYVFVFVGVFLESIFLTGWIAPGTAALLLGGFFSARGDLNVLLVGGLAAGAAIAGDNVGYILGRFSGDKLVSRFGDRFKISQRVDRVRDFFDRYGGVSVLFGRLISGIDAFVPLTAGMGRMSYPRYMAYDVPAALVWTGGLISAGYLFGESWEAIERVVGVVGWAFLGLLALALLGIYLLKRKKGAG